MKLSIIIITKQEEKYLPKLLKSIKRQSFKDYEIIVSDANSTDNTKKIARKFGCKVVRGGLPSKGRNNGMKHARAKYVLFLDADVVLPESFLERNLNEFINKDLVCATTYYIPLSDKVIDKIFYKTYNSWAYLMQYVFPHAGGICIFCTKDVFYKVKGFNEKLLMAEDHNFVNNCKRYGKFRLLKSVPLFCDVRRLEKDGRLNLVKKYIKGGAHRIFKGEMYEPIFEYELQGNVNIGKNK